MLPREVVMRPDATGTPPLLRTTQVLIMVIGSSRFRHKSERAFRTWCRSPRGVRCLFFSDADAGDASAGMGDEAALPMVTIGDAEPPSGCCSPRSRRNGFFCAAHRKRTLRAQYRFLPALEYVRSSAAFASAAFQWILLVDDDSFVFVPRLLWILQRLDPSHPLYAGDFGSSGEATALRIPHFSCGGGGSLLSAEALRRMDVSVCLRRYRSRCMQSDWMIGGCARYHNVSELRTLGCGTCDAKRLAEPRYRAVVRAKLREERCYFLQNAEVFARELPLGLHSAAVVHGLRDAEQAAFFRKHNATYRLHSPTRTTTSRPALHF